MTVEAMRKVIGPPAPLLHEINFAAILDDVNEEESTDDDKEEKPTPAAGL
jgi:hypothetical protein